MEAIGLAISPIAVLISESLSISSERSKLYDTTNSWKPLLSLEESFLEILDIPLYPGKPTRHIRKSIDKHNTLEDLPTQEIHTIRVCFMENICDYRKRSPIETTSFAGSPAMISQWGLSPKKIHWETHSYKLSLAPTSKEETRSGSSEHPYIDSISIAAGTIRRRLRCTIDSTEDERITCEYIPPILHPRPLIVSLC